MGTVVSKILNNKKVNFMEFYKFSVNSIQNLLVVKTENKALLSFQNKQ